MSVSVIVPVFNNARFLRAAILSLLAEAMAELQIVVVDDGSTESCLETIADLPVTTLRLPKNRGQAAARNAGLSLAVGKKIAFLDSDDLLETGSLRRRSSWLDEHPEAMGIQGSIFQCIDENGEELTGSVDFKALHARLPEVITWEHWKNGLTIPAPLIPCMLRRSIFELIGTFDETLRYAEDLDLFYRFLKVYSLPHLFEPVFRYRIHGRNLSIKGEKENWNSPPRVEAERILLDYVHGFRSCR